jgi:hypothetical protein
VRPILLASNSTITFAAIDIISFFVSAWLTSGVLAPFSALKLLQAMKALSTLRPASIFRPAVPWTIVQW